VHALTDLDLQNTATPHLTNQPMDTLVHNQPQETQHPTTDSTSPAASKVRMCCYVCVHDTAVFYVRCLIASNMMMSSARWLIVIEYICLWSRYIWCPYQ